MSTIAVERTKRYAQSVALRVYECPDCGVAHGLPVSLAVALQKVAGTYCCPNGHRIGWHDTEADKERRRADAAERRATQAEAAAATQRRRADRERLTAIALRGHLTRMRTRIANGVCPVPGCHRSGFSRVRAHLASKHPEWLAEHVHDLEAP